MDPPTEPATQEEAVGVIRDQLERLVMAVLLDGIPRPTAIVLSGDPRGPEFTGFNGDVQLGKSVHAFWRGHHDVDLLTWKEIQQGLVVLLDGDASTTSPVHRMRQGGIVSHVDGAFLRRTRTPRVQTILWIGDRVDLTDLRKALAPHVPTVASPKPPRRPALHADSDPLQPLSRTALPSDLRDRLNAIGSRLEPRIRALIENGHRDDDGYPSRSEADMAAVRGLVRAGATDDQIVLFFRLFDIGEKTLEEGLEYLERTIAKVRAGLTEVELLDFKVARNRLAIELLESATARRFTTGIDLRYMDVLEHAREAFGLKPGEEWIVAVGRVATVELEERAKGPNVTYWIPSPP